MTTPLRLPGTATDGLVRPLNAPVAAAVLPGVQPGVQGGVVLAQYVIIFGTAGGMFIYQGTPGTGNPPVFSVSNATTDPYGNPIAAGIWAGQFGQTQAGLQVTGTSGELAFPVAGTSPVLVGGVSGVAAGAGGAEVQIFSPQDQAPASDRVFMVLADNKAVGTGSAAYFLIYKDANGVLFAQATGGAGGLALVGVSGITAVLPGTGLSNTNAAQPETWHAATLINGWAGSGANENGLFYRLLPLGPPGKVMLEVKADIINAGGAPANSVCATLSPADYHPAVPQNHLAQVNNPQPNNSATAPWINYATNGNIQVTALQPVNSTKEVFFHNFVPLGSIP